MADATLSDVYKAFGATEASLRAARVNLVLADATYRAAGSRLPQAQIDAWNVQRRDLINNVAYFTEKAIGEVEAIPVIGAMKAKSMRTAIKEATGSSDPAIAMQNAMLPLKRDGSGALAGLGSVSADLRGFAGAHFGSTTANLGALPLAAGGGYALAIGAAVAIAAIALSVLVSSFFPKAKQAEAEALRVEASAKLALANADAYAKAIKAQVDAGVDPKTAAENAKSVLEHAPPPIGGAFDWMLPVGIGIIALVILWKSGVFAGFKLPAGFKVPALSGRGGRGRGHRRLSRR